MAGGMAELFARYEVLLLAYRQLRSSLRTAAAWDGSREWLLQQPEIRVPDAVSGNGLQQKMKEQKLLPVLLFLHADCPLNFPWEESDHPDQHQKRRQLDVFEAGTHERRNCATSPATSIRPLRKAPHS